MTALFSARELKDLIISWLLVSAAFQIVFFGLRSIAVPGAILFSLILVGAGFILHELAHKFVARHYGAWAEYRAEYTMLPVTVLFAFFGVLFAAPGAVVILGHLTHKRNGIIALAGPAANIVLAGIFLALGNSASTFLSQLGAMGVFVNLYLAGFNMLPFGQFDGAKVFAWSKIAWAVTLVLVGLGFVVTSSF